MTKKITNVKEAGKFTRQVIIKNFENFEKFDSPKGAYQYFKEYYQEVNITYDAFWYHLKKAKEAIEVSSNLKKKAKPIVSKQNEIKVGNEETIMPDADIDVLPTSSIEDIEIKIYNPENETINEDFFEPYTTGKFKDFITSEENGIMPGTTIVYTGGPNVGKTTVALNDLYYANVNYDKKHNIISNNEFIYLSSEMKRIDLQNEERKKTWMKSIKSVLLNEYPRNQYKNLIEKVILHGYRILVIDSFQDIVEKLVCFSGMTASSATTFLLNLIETANTGHTTTKINTTILLIQQVTKGGVFVGKNSIKHSTTAMLEFSFDDDKQSRYCEFSKNRRNGGMVFKKLYYSLNDKQDVIYDEIRFTEDRERENIIKIEKNNMAINVESFNNMFLPSKESNEDNDINWDDEELEDAA